MRDYLMFPTDVAAYGTDTPNSITPTGNMQAVAVKVLSDFLATTALILVGAPGAFHFGAGLYDPETLFLVYSFPNFNITLAGVRQITFNPPMLIKAGVYFYVVGVESGATAVTFIETSASSGNVGTLRAGAGLMGQSTNGVGADGIPPNKLLGFKMTGVNRIPVLILKS